MREADGAPSEEGEEGGQVREPGEDGRTLVVHVEVGQAAADDERDDESGDGATGFVGFAEDLGL